MHSNNFSKALQELKSFKPEQIQENVSLRNLSYLKTGGYSDYFITINQENQLEEIIHFLKENQLPYLVLGRATNIIIKEGRIKTVILYPQFSNYYQQDKIGELWLSASLPLIRGLKIAHDHKLKGLEFVMGIPGSVGGAVVMNAGVKNGDVKQVLKKIKIYRDGKIRIIPASSLDLKYRSSNIIKGEVVINACFNLEKVSKEEIDELKKYTLQQLALRKKSQPLKQPSIGSTFKNPLPNFAGELIEKAQLKGMRQGGISVSKQHANFIVNDGSGTSDQALELIERIKEEVYQKTGIALELEVKKFGY